MDIREKSARELLNDLIRAQEEPTYGLDRLFDNENVAAMNGTTDAGGDIAKVLAELTEPEFDAAARLLGYTPDELAERVNRCNKTDTPYFDATAEATELGYGVIECFLLLARRKAAAE